MTGEAVMTGGEVGPFVLRGCIEDWAASRWTPDTLVSLFGDQRLSVRFGLRQHDCGRVLFEPQCPRLDASLADFFEWADGKRHFGELRADSHWGYVDYKYLFDTIPPNRLKDVDWTAFGLDADGTDSAVWIGTAGAYTPCHYDTYGFNLHAQLFGKKRWLLFPPSDDLKATRIPYEDSSVFSNLDILSCPVELSSTHPHMVELEPGDVLYVPPHWWHFVQCLDLSISVNAWMPVAQLDAQMRQQEACTRMLFALLCRNGLIDQQSALCPSETKTVACEDTLALLNAVAADVDKQVDDLTDASEPPPAKKQRQSDDTHSAFVRRFLNSPHRRPVAVVDMTSLKTALENGPLHLLRPSAPDDDIVPTRQEVTEQRFLDCLLHPQVMSALAAVINRT